MVKRCRFFTGRWRYAGSAEYPQGTRSDRILRDIDKFFDTGELPQISDVQRFRYSLDK